MVFTWSGLSALEKTVLVEAMNAHGDGGVTGTVTIFGMEFEISVQHERLEDRENVCLVCTKPIERLRDGCRSIETHEYTFHKSCVLMRVTMEDIPLPVWDGGYGIRNGKLMLDGNEAPSGAGLAISADLSDAKIEINLVSR